ncbi:MAG: cupin domain-containing protein [Chroococcidiopsidaceae cyanobacterium CP_BM_RX_35]|nr:cupin domain-containing protein [Chroococcidiopsidaceae cyanobacterium CP_BM_RX_35]
MKLGTILATPAWFFICAVLPVRGQPAVKLLLNSSTTAGGQPLQYPQTTKPEIKSELVTIPPGGQTGWHEHPNPTYAYIMTGKLTVETASGQQRQFKQGDSFLEVINTCHDGRNLGNIPAQVLVVFMGRQGKPDTIRCTGKPPSTSPR